MRRQASFRILISCVLTITGFLPAIRAAGGADSNDPGVTVIRGDIEKFTTTLDGRTNGAILDNEYETVLQWPVHLQDKFKPPLQPGDRVRAVGRWSTDNAGAARYLVKTLTNLKSKQTVENRTFTEDGPGTSTLPPNRAVGNAATPDSSPAPIPTKVERTIVVRGRIERFTLGPGGETIGAVLDSDSEIVLRWPAALQERFLGVIKLGDRVRATGRRLVGPADDNVIAVKTVTNLASRESAEDPGYVDTPPRSSREEPVAAGTREAELERRVRALEDRVEELRREIARLRAQK